MSTDLDALIERLRSAPLVTGSTLHAEAADALEALRRELEAEKEKTRAESHLAEKWATNGETWRRERDEWQAHAEALRLALEKAGRALRWAIDYGRRFDHLPHCERGEQRHPAGYVCTCGYDAQEESLEPVCVRIAAALASTPSDSLSALRRAERIAGAFEVVTAVVRAGYICPGKWVGLHPDEITAAVVDAMEAQEGS